MRAGWSGTEPPLIPPFGTVDRLRMIVRGALAGVLTAGLFGVYLVLQLLDRFVERLTLAPRRESAPGVVRLWARAALPLLGLRRSVAGAPMPGRGVFVANHASWIDIVALQSAARVSFIAKAEVADWPGVGLIGRRIGTLFIERRATRAREQSDALAERLGAGERLCLFAEGTSSDGRRVLPFKSTLFGPLIDPARGAGFAVQPVTIAYDACAPLSETFYAWWGDMDFASHLRAVLALSGRGRVRIIFHAPLDPGGFADRKALAAACEDAVRRGHATALAAA